MGKIKAPLSVLAVQKLAKKDGYHAVGGAAGLYLRVEGESRTWVFRHSFAGRRRDMGLGPIGEMSLEDARAEAALLRKKIREGVDPMAERRNMLQQAVVSAIKRITFKECMEAYLDAQEGAWKNQKHRQQWRNTLEAYAVPVLGNVPVATIDTGMVMKVLEPIWKTKTETASRVRGRIETVLTWATVRGHRQGDNPARWRGHIDALLPAANKVAKRGHFAALPYRELGTFIKDLREMQGIAARAVEFTILAAARSGETRGATWSEVNLEEGVWIVPAERMKAKRDHRVPLAPRALAILKSMPQLAETPFIFPGSKGKPLSDMTLTAVLKRMGRVDLTVHGFRSTFRDWAAEMTGYPSEMAEMALAHTISSKTEAAYRRGDLFEKRRRMMRDWAEYAETVQGTADVTPIRKSETAA